MSANDWGGFRWWPGRDSSVPTCSFSAVVRLGIEFISCRLRCCLSPSVLTRELVGRKRIGLVGITWVVLGMPAVIWADSAWVGLQTNQRFVETEIIQPLKAAAPGSEVVVSTNLPAPSMSYGFAFLMPRYEEALKTYYELPRDLNITKPLPAPLFHKAGIQLFTAPFGGKV